VDRDADDGLFGRQFGRRRKERDGSPHIRSATGVVSAIMRSGDLAEIPAQLEFELSHPAFADRDRLITLNKAMPDADGNPVWVGHLLSVPDERFYAVLSSGDEWRLSAEWQGDASLMLRPGGTSSDDSL
jgi:hypothetical protein